MPQIDQAVIIDGWTQPGWSGTPLIELRGTNLPSNNSRGLRLMVGGSTVRGLAIGGFYAAIELRSSGNAIQGNHIGVDAAGLNSVGNEIGVQVNNVAGNLIGGANPGSRNLIAGNGFGIAIAGSFASGTRIEGNYIGSDLNGTAALSNGIGIQIVNAFNTVIGGSGGSANLISGNTTGIVMGVNATGNQVIGNLIGTDASGLNALPNDSGIVLSGASQNSIGASGLGNVIAGNFSRGIMIGEGVSGEPAARNRLFGNLIGVARDGSSALPNGIGIHLIGATETIIGTIGAGNMIAYNLADGVLISQGLGSSDANQVRGNRIFANGGLGINLQASSSPGPVTPNDGCANGGNPNNGIDYPTIYSAQLSAGNLVVRGEACSGGNVEIFLADADPSGYGQGSRSLGTVAVDDAVPGLIDPAARRFTLSIPAGSIILGDELSAVVTDANANSSEFGLRVTVTP
ncbi:MAG: hypothetical protein HC822_17990 [Oscillochloris sp.]|nr:hypothetical protein [Oscillochloris sp.]